MEYIYETHCHTREASACGELSGQELARFYKSRGFDGIFVTDHFFNGNCAVDPSLDWQTKCELYCAGYKAAKAEGDRIGLSVFFGIEYSYLGTDLLTYGVDGDWLKAHVRCRCGRGIQCGEPRPGIQQACGLVRRQLRAGKGRRLGQARGPFAGRGCDGI